MTPEREKMPVTNGRGTTKIRRIAMSASSVNVAAQNKATSRWFTKTDNAETRAYQVKDYL